MAAMARSARSYVAMLLCALLVLTSASTAMARLAPDPTGYMVLCIGERSVLVQIDNEGQPVAPSHHCPDCTISALTALLPVTLSIQLVGPSALLRFHAAAPPVRGQHTEIARARGPPVSVVSPI